MRVADEIGRYANARVPRSWQRFTTWALRDALGGNRWWERASSGWSQHVDGLWRRRIAGAQTTTEKKVRRPLVVRYPESKWSLEQFLAHRRRVGRHDGRVTEADINNQSEAAEVVVVICRSNDDDTACRRMLYRARQNATHAVVAVVPDRGAGKMTEQYLGLCAGAGRNEARTSGSEDRLAKAFETLGVDARRQVPVGRYRLDFFIRGTTGDTDVEVDGRYWHTDEDGKRLPADCWRDEVLASIGIRTVRVWAEDVYSDPRRCAERAMRQHEQ